MATKTDENNNPLIRSRKRFIEHWQIIAFFLVVYDLLAIHLAYFLALWLRFDCVFSQIPTRFFDSYKSFVLPYAIVCILVFAACKLYRSVWRFASYIELILTTVVSLSMSVLHFIFINLLVQRMPVSYHLMGAALQLILLVGVRFSYRLILLVRKGVQRSNRPIANVMLIGAGNAGQMLLRDINHSDSREKVVCIIDDNPNKWDRYIDGILVVGGRDSILKAVKDYYVNKIYFAIPSATAEERREILSICNESGCEVKQIPRIYQTTMDQITSSSLKNISMEDLLGREPITTDMSEVFQMIRGKTVLVTGGGGSIGSELCRQIAAHSPGQLILFDIYENNAYDIQQELKRIHPELDLVVLIGSVRDSRKVFSLFKHYRPQIVYHAAAHKHVPLMEDSPCEAIKNNTLGTYKTAYAAMVHGCERFVLISTDKAVNPTNIMGASKRLCEMVIQGFYRKIAEGKADEIPQLFTHEGQENADKDGTGEVFRNVKTQFMAVRFGNVLGSNGSVVPLFKKQIDNGGPVTVTHPDIIRYFMTISEAVSLVMLAGTYAQGGEIFVLDMGSPVKIDTLARNLIRLSGLKPDEDIKIVYSGLRPGEKMYEEKLMAEEGMKKTQNDLIHIGSPIEFDVDRFFKQLEELMIVAYNNDKNIDEKVAEIVTTYHPAYNR